MSIPLYEVPLVTSGTWYRQPIQMGGEQVVLELQYNERADLWYLDILDAAEQPVVQGIALRCGRDLLRPYRTRIFKDATLFVIDTTGKQTDPSLNSFLLTHKLLFGSTT